MGIPSRKEKAGETALYTAEVLQKMVLGFMPGGHVVDGFLNYRSGLKQKRVIDFGASVIVMIERYTERELSADDFQNEDFVDVLDSILAKAQMTKSKYKLEHFRNILVKQAVKPPTDTGLALKFIQIIDGLTEIQILILEKMKKYLFPEKVDFVQLIAQPYDEKNSGRWTVHVQIGGEIILTAIDEIDFYVNELHSLGLVEIEFKEGSSHEGRMDKYYMLTSIGREFLEFIVNPINSSN